MITAVHLLQYSRDPAGDRAFLRDVLGWQNVEDVSSEPGWLIFALPPTELGVHPTEGEPLAELHLMCDDIEATVADLQGKGVEITGPVEDLGYGLATAIRLPSGATVGLTSRVMRRRSTSEPWRGRPARRPRLPGVRGVFWTATGRSSSWRFVDEVALVVESTRAWRETIRGADAVSTAAGTREQLPKLALTEWEATKDTLHLWVQIVGKVRMASTAPRNHWWHVPLYVAARGLTTRRMHAGDGLSFQIDFDLIDHRLVIATNRAATASFKLVDGLSVAEFDEKLHAKLAELGIEVAIRETPFGLPTTTPFSADREHDSYDRDAVERFWRALEWTDEVFEEFAGWYCGKTSPVHLFWHSFDLALTRFGGQPAPALPDADPVNRETYSHELVSFGFWPGDQKIREPSYYSYTAPEPAALRVQPLSPKEAVWSEYGDGSLALLPYEAVRTAPDPKASLLAFLESAYQAGAGASGWDRAGLESSWCPSPSQLSDLLEVSSQASAAADEDQKRR